MASRGAPADDGKHWRTLSLSPGAPECVIRAAHRYYIEKHHPDRGGDVAEAQRINVANDELKDMGASANDYVAANYSGEPWLVLGLAANAPKELAERAGRALARELESLPKLASRVDWAIENFGRATRVKIRPATPPPPRPSAPPVSKPRTPAVPGMPEGLPNSINLGTLRRGADAAHDIRLTWRENAPYGVRAEASRGLRAEVNESRAVPGRFVVSVSVDWDNVRQGEGARSTGFVESVRLTWGGGGTATIHVHWTLLHPPTVTAQPAAIDIGTTTRGEMAKATLVLMSTADTTADVSCSAWLARVDGAGRAVETPVRLAADTPVRLSFAVRWEPIAERARRWPVRPTGKITVRWDDRSVEIPVEMVAHDARPRPTGRPGSRR